MTSTDSIPIPDLASTLPETATANTPHPQTTHTLPPPFTTSDPPPTLLTQGAEALVYKTTFLTPSTPAALKFRPSKPYRHPTLDARLTKARVLAEARVLVRLSALSGDGVNVPAVLGVEWDIGRRVKGLSTEQRQAVGGGRGPQQSVGAGAWILMEWIEGTSVKQLLRDWDVWWKAYGQHADGEVKTRAEDGVKALLGRMGRAVAAMHWKGGVVHGDLTSSNIMVRPSKSSSSSNVTSTETNESSTQHQEDSNQPPDLNGSIVLIDFGLSTQTVQEEDRAVDLYVLERAFGSTHPMQEAWFDEHVLQSASGYRGAWKGASPVLKRLEDVRMRGRKRTMVG